MTCVDLSWPPRSRLWDGTLGEAIQTLAKPTKEARTTPCSPTDRGAGSASRVGNRCGTVIAGRCEGLARGREALELTTALC